MPDVVSTDGTRLALTTWGPPEAPLVVLVHGMGMSTSSWGDVPGRLAGSCRVVAYDLRGHGDSGAARGGSYSLATHAADLGAVLDQVRSDGERATALVHSLGGAILLEHVATTGDDELSGIVFAGSGGSAVTLPGLPDGSAPAPLAGVVRGLWLAVVVAAIGLGHALRPWRWLTARLTRWYAFAPGAPEHLVARVREDFLRTRGRALARTALASLSHDGQQLAPAVTVPVTVVHGSDDSEVSGPDAERLVERIARAELVEVPDGGHMLPLTHPDVVVDAVLAMVQRTGDADRPRASA
ncbi:MULTISPECIES: alpha/beta fold hydrolase [unclassified Modestobacter]